MKVRDAVARLREMDQDATLLTARDGFSVEIDIIENTQVFCEVGPHMWQRCWVEETVCDRKQIEGVLLI